MKMIIQGTIAALAMIATSAQAIPTLEFFGGDLISGGVTYTADAQNATGLLEVDAYLIGSTDIAPLPIISGSSLTFSATLDSTDLISGFIAGFFSSSDLVVMGGSVMGNPGIELLTGSFTQLAVAGQEGNSFGFVQGTFTATGGSLISEFGLGTLFALELNLSNSFTTDIFQNDFTAQIDGEITGQTITVPEPGMLALLGLGILLLGFNYRAKTKTNFNA